jgi:hypothetical protein
MNESITTVIELPELRSRIKAEDSKARNIAKKSLAHVIECGRLLIELKARVNHGHWKYEARQLNMSPRTISNYMKIARNGNVAVLGKGVRDALRLLSIAENPPPPPSPSRPADIVVDAEIVVHAPKVETPDEMFQRGLDSLQESMPPVEFVDLLETALAKNPEAERVDEPPAPAVAPATASAAPSMIETSETTLTEILELLKRLRPAEITELHRVIESRWMKTTSTAPATLSEAWSKTSPEDRAAFLETAHLIEKP